MISKKIVLIGDYATGKTSLIRRFVDNEFSDNYLSTIGVKISSKNVMIGSLEVQNIIWDVEGSTETKPIAKSYLLGLHGAIVVADVRRRSTIINLQNHINLLREVSAEVPIVIALNKSDLLGSEEGEQMLEDVESLLDSPLYIKLTSAKTGESVEDLFEKLSTLMVE